MTFGKKRGAKSLSSAIFFMITVCAFASLLKNPDIAIGYMRQGLRLCAKIVIPSLFPFMVLSGLFVELGVSDFFSRILWRPMRTLFGISGQGSSAPIMGAVCGFPVGALTAKRLYDRGEISREEFSRLLTFSNNASSAFLISATGSALWSNAKFGVVLYVIQIITAVIIGVAQRIIFPIKNSGAMLETEDGGRDAASVRIFVKVVSESALSMLNVCALILFFASVVGALISTLEGLGCTQTVKALIYGFFEISGAVSEAAKVLPHETGMVITALVCGWSGLCIHFQIIALCGDSGISFAPYFAAKAAQGVLSALAMLFYIKVIDPSLPSLCVPAFARIIDEKNTVLTIVANAVFVFGVFVFAKKRFRSSRVFTH
ncbi:MAG: hypothetical protein IKT56_01430 [Clostridia bacterium]|nr:hypothetical protein [Clostridia bacterium]